MKNLWFLAILFAGLTFATSCKDDDEDVHDHNDGELEYHAHIMSPDATDKKVGDSIHIHINFEEHNGGTIHHINVKIYQEDDASIIIYNKPEGTDQHIHQGGSYEYHADVSLDGIPPHKNWILEAKVWAEEEGKNEVVETLQFHVHPQ